MITWAQWLREATGGRSIRQIASETSFSKSSLSTWNQTNRPPAEAVIAIAKRYDADVLVALVCSGYMEPNDIGAAEELSGIPTETLIDELHRRWRSGEIGAPLEPMWG